MWHASYSEKSDFILSGSLRKLFLKGVYETLELFFTEKMSFEELSDNEEMITTNGSPYHNCYNNLTNAEKIYAISEVTRHLTSKSKAPKLFQWNESAIYAVFQSIQAEISFEIDAETHFHGNFPGEHSHDWRRLVSAAEREFVDYGIEEDPDDEESEYINPLSQDHDEWDDVVDSLSETILWDQDFLCEDIFLDAPPECSKKIKMYAGVDDDYFLTPIPTFNKLEFQKAARFLEKIIKEEC